MPCSTVARILRMLRLPDGTIRVLVEGGERASIVRYLDSREFFKVQVRPIEEQRSPGPDAEARAGALLRGAGLAPRGFVQIHPGSRWFFKTWPAASVAALADLVAPRFRIVITGAPDPRERALVDEVVAALA